MYAVIRTGGKQYRVAADEVIRIEKLPGEAGDQVVFEDVLLVGNGEDATIGAPTVAGASVAGEVVEQARARKIIVFKKKRRKNYRRTQGHRQHLTVVRITEILTDGAKPSPKKEARKAPKKAEDDKTAKGAKTEDKTAEAKPATRSSAKKDQAEAKPAEETKVEAQAEAAPAAEAKTEDTAAAPAEETPAADEAKKD